MEPLPAGLFTLRPYRPDDVDELVRATHESVATVGRWMPWCHLGYVAAEAQEWIAHTAAALAQHTDRELAIVDGADRLVGGVGLNQFNARNNFCNLGYWIRQSRQRGGAATAAAAALARYGFAQLRLTRIEIVVQEGNTASARVAEKIGALQPGQCRIEGRQRELRRRLADQRGRNEIGIDPRLEPDQEDPSERCKDDQGNEEHPSPPRNRRRPGIAHGRPAERRRTPRASSSASRRFWARPSKKIHRNRPVSTAAVSR